MFLDPYLYPFARRIENGSMAIRAECDRIPLERFVSWPEREIYDFGWRAYPLVALQHVVPTNAAACPMTMQALAAVPDLVNAGFSLFAGRTHVHPHVGYSTSVYRFHLGLQIPAECGLCVAGERRCWEEGKLLAFDDMVEHFAWNDSDEHRVVLLFDVLRPGATMEVTLSALRAIEQFSAELPNSDDEARQR